jgi:hypothetical protein
MSQNLSYPPRVPASGGLPVPVAYEAIPGTGFAVAIVGVAPTTSGPATASLVAGIGSILVSFVVACFGTAGAQGGWGPLVAGAFAVLAGLAGVAALALARAGLVQIRRAAPTNLPSVAAAASPGVTGRGLAISGLICGFIGLTFTAVALLGSLALTAAQLE